MLVYLVAKEINSSQAKLVLLNLDNESVLLQAIEQDFEMLLVLLA